MSLISVNNLTFGYDESLSNVFEDEKDIADNVLQILKYGIKRKEVE